MQIQPGLFRLGVFGAFFLALAIPAARAQESSAFAQTTTQDIAAIQRESLDKLANDFPQLGHYREQNMALRQVKTGEHRIVFFGDSLTEAWGLKGNGSVFFPGRPYLNRGISGQTTMQMLLRFRQDVIDLHPDAVVVLAGTNDFAGNTGPASPAMVAANIRSMADLARANHIRFIVCSLLPTDHYAWRPDAKPAGAIRALNTYLRSFAKQRGLVYIDYYSALATPEGTMREGLSHDGVHLNPPGYEVMAPLAEAGIAAALKHKP